MRGLALAITGMELPAIEKISESQAEDPFQVLIATLLSRAYQDAPTHAASVRLFSKREDASHDGAAHGGGDRAADLSRELLPQQARFVKATADTLATRFGGRVPRTWRS